MQSPFFLSLPSEEGQGQQRPYPVKTARDRPNNMIHPVIFSKAFTRPSRESCRLLGKRLFGSWTSAVEVIWGGNRGHRDVWTASKGKERK